MNNSNTYSTNKTDNSKDEFKINYIFKEKGLPFMNYIEENFKRYIQNLSR